MEVTLTLTNGIVRIRDDCKVFMSGSATPREAAAASLIHAVSVALNDSEFDLSRMFTKEEFEIHRASVNSRIIRCRWTKNGYLKRIGETEDQFKHANNVKEALSRAGAFTCTTSTFDRIPKSRPSNRKPDTRDRTSTPKPIVPANNSNAPGAGI